MTTQNENDPDLDKYDFSANLVLLAQIAMIISGITIGILIYTINLPVYYLSFILFFQLLVIPYFFSNAKLLKQKKQRRQSIITQGISSHAEIISTKMVGSGGDIDNYYTFELRPESSEIKVTAFEAMTSETYALVCGQGKIPIRYLPEEQVAVILVDQIPSESIKQLASPL
ncbi:hypothetical protein CAP48_18410 [Advenella sp. S44]|uniref:hypothetical protein n=1 Tax=Advenella sp. S44 TaxID=1982755 RepID=UPI000C2A5878|nr:hypothetical protein [Advenella sp. S44]PJX20380.1 hypothetical protein CAP48_18410 [Advenella sp. S44]